MQPSTTRLVSRLCCTPHTLGLLPTGLSLAMYVFTQTCINAFRILSAVCWSVDLLSVCLSMHSSRQPSIPLSVCLSHHPSTHSSTHSSMHLYPLLLCMLQLHALALLFPSAFSHASNQYKLLHQSQVCMTYQLTRAIGKPRQHYINYPEQQDAMALHEHPHPLL